MPELLAPVGNMECLKAAINAGCDAVYLSGKNFGARSFASNFSLDELSEAINLCHLYGVKVYITVNTLIYDIEVEKFMSYIDFIHKHNVDAVIMQDIGMIDLVRKTYPNLEIHASTQLNIHNLDGVKLCKSLGIKRVVLARETPIQLIEEIKNDVNIDLEIFVHGALCMCYSGECLMSALIGNRSGNRGTCAQCCRQPYSLEIDSNVVSTNKYLLSTKDLNTINNIGKLIDLGVESLKIEGRMKSPYYVYLVTSLYRKAIDNYKKHRNTKITEDDILEIKKVFNRDFTKGFMFNEENDNFVNTFRPNHIGIQIGYVVEYKNNRVKIKLNENLNINDGIRIIGNSDVGMTVSTIYKDNNKIEKANKGDIITLPLASMVEKDDMVVKTTDYNQMLKIKSLIDVDRKVKINGECTLKVGNPLRLTISDGYNVVEKYSDFIIESARNSIVSKDKVTQQLSKLGNSAYIFDNLNITMDDNIFVPINKLNELRRDVIDMLNQKRLYEIPYKKCNYEINVPNFNAAYNKSILVNNYNDYKILKNKYDTIYVEENLYNEINDKECVLKLSRIQEHLKDYNVKLLVGELGSVYKYKNIDIDFSLNIFNSYSVAFLHSVGVSKITLSYELSYKQIKLLIENYKKRYNKNPNVEVIIKGHEETMVCKYNMLKKYNKNVGYLIDRFNNKYKIVVKNDLMYIYNYKMRNLKENFYNIGVNSVRINLD